MTLAQIVRRPTLPPYVTPVDGVFLCSSSTPPGGGVHGMCGYLAAVVAAKHMGVTLLKLTSAYSAMAEGTTPQAIRLPEAPAGSVF